MQSLVSVIIPVYNNEKYLRKCLDSVLSQKYENWEAILVDDGSSDDSESICSEYAAADPRFRVVHKENGGVSSARNAGLRYMNGEYFCFIDADDYVGREYISCMVNGIETAGADLSACRLSRTDGAGDTASCPASGKHRILDKDKALMSLFDEKRGICGYIAGKLFRSEIVLKNGLCFDEGQRYCEDLMFTFDYLSGCRVRNTLSVCDEVQYFYLQHEGSVLNRRFSSDSFDESWYGLTEAYDKLLERCPDDSKLRHAISMSRVMQCVTLMRVMNRFEMRSTNEYRIYKKYVGKYLFSYLFSGSFTFRKRVGALLILIFPKI